jgi:hypothetical protein
LKKFFSGKSKAAKGSGAAGAVGKGLFDVEEDWDDTPDEVGPAIFFSSCIPTGCHVCISFHHVLPHQLC